MGTITKIIIEAVVISLLVKILSNVNWEKVGSRATKDFREKAENIYNDVKS